MTKISIVIPVLNEAENIGRLIRHLHLASTDDNIAEIIVVDGGSSDESVAIASAFENVKILNQNTGRAKQMNAGARIASGDVLYFLHADSFPPSSFDTLILNEIAKNNLAGCFRLKFDNNHWWLRLAGWFTQFNWLICRGGDQSQFIHRQLFEDLGGYDESFVIYEDNDLIRKLYDRKQFKVINKPIITSARCYEKNGIWRLQYHFWAIYLKKRMGASADELLNYYKKNII